MARSRQARTRDYYALNAGAYFEQTHAIDMADVYTPFESHLAPQSQILDLGCGSGRDARHFAAAGYRVVAADPCGELLSLASRNTPQPLRKQIRFVRAAAPAIAFGDGHFDALWACASLLHLPPREMPPALADCRRVLRPGGVMFVAVKQKQQEARADDRYVAMWEADSLSQRVKEASFDMIGSEMRSSFTGRRLAWINLLARAR